jgi:GTP-binding protein HflX
VNAVLREIGAGDLPQLLVYNKIDRLQETPRLERNADGEYTQAWISASQGQGLDGLQYAIAERLGLKGQRAWLTLAPGAGAVRARLLAGGVVVEERTLDDGRMQLLVQATAAALAALAREHGGALAPLAADSPCPPPTGFLESVAAGPGT